MTDSSIKIETSPEGIQISQDSPSPEWSITDKGGRMDSVFIDRNAAQAVIKALQPFANEAREVESI
jgi:hypothetical protein